LTLLSATSRASFGERNFQIPADRAGHTRAAADRIFPLVYLLLVASGIT